MFSHKIPEIRHNLNIFSIGTNGEKFIAFIENLPEIILLLILNNMQIKTNSILFYKYLLQIFKYKLFSRFYWSMVLLNGSSYK